MSRVFDDLFCAMEEVAKRATTNRLAIDRRMAYYRYSTVPFSEELPFMKARASSFALLILTTVVAALCFSLTRPTPLAQTTPAVSVDADDLGGVVTGPKGPEAGVWVIAETTDLPTKFAKIV